MATTTLDRPTANGVGDPWTDFVPGLWTKEINVRDFIQENYKPYYEDEKFLAGPTKRTLGIWKQLTDMFVEERKKGILDVSQIPSSITAHDAGVPSRCRMREPRQEPCGGGDGYSIAVSRRPRTMVYDR